MTEREVNYGAWWPKPTFKPLSSWSQNFEDARLARVFDGGTGFYVDVGAGDPVEDSVTKLFYDRGWSGINIEPGPAFASLVRERPRDVNLNVAVSVVPQLRDFWISSPHPGLSTFSPEQLRHLPEGYHFHRVVVPCRPLRDIIAEHAAERHIDFLKIDVEGAELEVLQSVDWETTRPTVIIVEAITPITNEARHDVFEPVLADAGYLVAAFDGVNRFYVSREARELIDALAYPISTLDAIVSRREQELIGQRDRAWRALAEVQQERDHLLEESKRLQAAASSVEAIYQSRTWRAGRIVAGIASPVMSVARLSKKLKRVEASARAPEESLSVSITRSRQCEHRARTALVGRLTDAAAILGTTTYGATDLPEALSDLARGLESAPVSHLAKAWLCLVALHASYPTESDVEAWARILRMDGPQGVIEALESAAQSGEASDAKLDLQTNTTLVDVTHTLDSHIHTGIQRVVRETVCRWLTTGRPISLVSYDCNRNSLRLLSDDETRRFTGWRDNLGDCDRTTGHALDQSGHFDVIVPWRCRLLLTELFADQTRCRAYRGLASADVLEDLGAIGYDLIPITAPETTTAGLSAGFVEYLSVLKHADRISAISRTSAHDFQAFASTTASQGLSGPTVAAHPLPAEPMPLTDEQLAAAVSRLEVSQLPLVLVIGSHEPRKNNVRVVEAAARIWARGCRFQLLLLGGSDTRSRDLEMLTARLVSNGRPIRIHGRCDETTLWAAYRIARFTVFASLLEGFGLPVAESLACGTPVLTSMYGSMAEIASEGGCLVVDPRDVDSLEHGMTRLLEDDGLLERLRREAQERRFETWDDYAANVWRFFAQDIVAHEVLA